MSAIRISILAASDPSLRTAFVPLEQAHDRAMRKINNDAKKASKGRADAGAGAVLDKHIADAQKAAEKRERVVTRALQDGERVRFRIKEASLRKMQAEEEAYERRTRTDPAGRRQRALTATRDFGRDAVGTFGRGARAVIGATGDIARGAGIDPSISGLTGRVVRTEAAAMRATLSGFAAENARRQVDGKASIMPTGVDVKSTMSAVRSAGDATSTSYGDVAAGLEALQTKTGKLEESKAMLEQIGHIAKATGSDFVDMASAAGDIAIAIDENDPQKVQKIGAALRLVATQGALGSLEIKDMAVLMSRLAAPAGRIGVDDPDVVGGRTFQDNLADMGAIAQMARHGGRTTATEQANTANAFVRDLTKKANLKKYDAAGLNVFANPEHTKMRSAREIIMGAFAKTKGDIGQLTALFPNEASKAGVMGMHGTYTDAFQKAGGGVAGEKAGLLALEKIFSKFSSAMSDKDVAGLSALAQETPEAKAAKFQNKLEKIATVTLDKLIPGLERLAPKFESLADTVGSFMVSISQMDPGSVIAIAIGASVAKAGVGAIISSTVEKAILGGGSGGAGPLGGAGGPAIIGAAIGAALVAYMLNEAVKNKAEAEDKARSKLLKGQFVTDNIVERFQQGDKASVPISRKEAEDFLSGEQTRLEEEIKKGEQAPAYDPIMMAGLETKAFMGVDGARANLETAKADQEARAGLENNKEALQQVQSAIKQLASSTLNVNIVGGLAPGGTIQPLFPSGPTRTGPAVPFGSPGWTP